MAAAMFTSTFRNKLGTIGALRASTRPFAIVRQRRRKGAVGGDVADRHFQPPNLDEAENVEFETPGKASRNISMPNPSSPRTVSRDRGAAMSAVPTAKRVEYEDFRVFQPEVDVPIFPDDPVSTTRKSKRTPIIKDLISKASNLDDILKALAHLKSGDPSVSVRIKLASYQAAINKAAALGDGESALMIFNDARASGVPVDVRMCGAVMRAMASCETADPEGLLLLLEELRTKDGIAVDDRCYTDAVRTLARAPLDLAWRRALDVLRKDLPAAGIVPSIYTCNECMHLLSRAGRWREAIEVLDAMVDGRKARTPMPPADKITFTEAIVACHLAGRHALGSELLRLMRTHGVPPDRTMVNAAMAASSRGGSLDYALQLMDLLRARLPAEPTPAPSSMGAADPGPLQLAGLSPDETSYTIAIITAGKNDNFKLAMSLFDEAKTLMEPGEMLVNGALMACAQCGSLDTALAILDEATSRKRWPLDNATAHATATGEPMAARRSHGDGGSAGGGVGGPTSKSISHTLLSYNAVLKACVRAGEPDVAVRLLQAMLDRQPTVAGDLPPLPDTASYNLVLHAFEKAERWEPARKVLDAMPRHLRNNFSYTMVVSAAARAKAWREALEAFDLMRLDGVAPNALAYKSAMNAVVWGSEGDPLAHQAGLAIMDAMDAERLWCPHSVGAALVLCRRVGLTERALRLEAYLKELDPGKLLHLQRQHRGSGGGSWEPITSDK